MRWSTEKFFFACTTKIFRPARCVRNKAIHFSGLDCARMRCRKPLEMLFIAKREEKFSAQLKPEARLDHDMKVIYKWMKHKQKHFRPPQRCQHIINMTMRAFRVFLPTANRKFFVCEFWSPQDFSFVIYNIDTVRENMMMDGEPVRMMIWVLLLTFLLMI